MSFDEQPDGDIHADNPASYSAEGVQCYLFALLKEAERRGEMFTQTEDEQEEDSDAVHRVCGMVHWYGEIGYPKPQQIDRLLKLRARNKMTNRETDGDIHGERAAESEPSELSAFEKWWAMLSKVPYMSKKEIAERAFYAGRYAEYAAFESAALRRLRARNSNVK